jgi:hypothetical protein
LENKKEGMVEFYLITTTMFSFANLVIKVFFAISIVLLGFGATLVSSSGAAYAMLTILVAVIAVNSATMEKIAKAVFVS